MRTRIKVCCIASESEAQMAIEEGADALGLVAEMPSGPGPISDDKIQKISRCVPPPISTFLLTSRTRAEELAKHVVMTQTTTVQIVSHIAEDESRRLAQLVPGVQRVRVIHVEDKTALDMIPVYSPHVDAFLLDSGHPNSEIAQSGGTGQTHDWDISATFVNASPIPVFWRAGSTQVMS